MISAKNSRIRAGIKNTLNEMSPLQIREHDAADIDGFAERETGIGEQYTAGKVIKKAAKMLSTARMHVSKLTNNRMVSAGCQLLLVRQTLVCAQHVH